MFPSLRSWFAALRLSIPNYLGFAAFTFMFWCLTIAAITIFVSSGEWQLPAIFMGIAGLTLLIGIIFYVLLSILWFGILKLFWSKPPSAIAPNWVRMPLNFAISLVAVLPIALIFVGRIIRDAAIETVYKVEMYLPDDYVELMFRFFWLWLLIAAYCHHFVYKHDKHTKSEAMKTELN